jgi:hypothetical protein
MATEADIGPQEVEAQSVAIIGIIGAILTFVLIVLVQVFFHLVQESKLKDKGVEEPLTSTVSQKAAQLEAITNYRWVDQKKNLVAVPIDLAMKEIIEKRNAGQKSYPSNPALVPAAPPPTPPGAAAGGAATAAPPKAGAEEKKKE